MGNVGASPDRLAALAEAFGVTTVSVQWRLDRIRNLMRSLSPSALGLTPDRWQALTMSYEIYVCILDEALTQIARGTGAVHVAVPSGPPASPDRQSRSTLSLAGRPSATARTRPVHAIREVAVELEADLRRLQDLRQSLGSRGDPPDREAVEQWAIAAHGLFGPTGLVSILTRNQRKLRRVGSAAA